MCSVGNLEQFNKVAEHMLINLLLVPNYVVRFLGIVIIWRVFNVL